MSVRHRIPMSPEELPQQQLVPVRSLPQAPEGIDLRVVYLRIAESESLPGEPGPDSDFVASVEWAWSPMHNRQDPYYLSADSSGWYLWKCGADPEEWSDAVDDEREPYWYLLAHCAPLPLAPREAAIHLLRAFLDTEREDWDTQLDRFHFVADLGILDVADLHAIARDVWSEQAEERADEGDTP